MEEIAKPLDFSSFLHPSILAWQFVLQLMLRWLPQNVLTLGKA